MNPLDILRAKLAQITADAKAIEAAAQAAGRAEFTDDETTNLNALHAAFENCEKQIAMHERNAAIEASAATLVPPKTGPAPAQTLPAYGTAARTQAVSASYQNHGFVRGFSEFVSAVKMAAYGKLDQRLLNAVTTYGGESTVGGGTDGGFAVPPQFAAAITEVVLGEDSLVAKFNPIMTSSNQVVLPTDETTPYGTSGIYAEWLGEASAMTSRAPSLKQVTVNLHKVGALVHLSDELVEDAPAIQSHVTRKVGQAIAAKVNAAIMNGDGLAKPLGLLKAPALVTVTKTGSGTPIASGDLPAMIGRIVPGSFGNSFWLCHNTVLPKVWTLTLGNFPVMVQDFKTSPYGNILGRPVYVTEFAQDYNTAGDIMLVSPDGYVVAIKAGGLQTAASIHFAFDQNLQSFRTTLRVGGAPLAAAAITRANGSATLSHIVCLGVRS
jgi:HK97 family phage major capsid protein